MGEAQSARLPNCIQDPHWSQSELYAKTMSGSVPESVIEES